MEYRIISGEGIRRVRGQRSLREVAKQADNAFSAAALLKWEQGKSQPKIEHVSQLLKVLGCTYADISKAVDLGVDQ